MRSGISLKRATGATLSSTVNRRYSVRARKPSPTASSAAKISVVIGATPEAKRFNDVIRVLEEPIRHCKAIGPCAHDGTAATVTAPASFSLLAPAYAKKYGVDEAEMKDVLTRIAWKNHRNGALNPRAQFRKEVPKDTIACSPLVAGPLGIFDCSGVSDGSAAAILVRAEDAHRYTDHPIYVKALSFVAGPAAGPIDPGYDYTTFDEVVRSRRGRLPPGRHHQPPGRAGHGRGARLLHARPSWS